MMSGNITSCCTDGTSAIDVRKLAHAKAGATIIPFPGVGNAERTDSGHSAMRSTVRTGVESAHAPQGRISNLLASSEMWCSLKFEDFRGCPYNVFTTRAIATLSTATALIAIVSLVIGA